MASAPPPSQVHEAIESLQTLAELFAARREQLAAEVGLTVQQWRVLEEISEEHFMPSMFARQRESSPAAVSKILRQLGDKGLVTASIAKGDGRQRRYALTAAGRRTMAALRRSRERAIRKVWMTFDPRQLTEFTRFSRDLIGRLEQFAPREE